MKLRWTQGELLRKARLDRGWKQSYLAEQAGLSVTAVIRLERESHKSEQETLTRVAEALEVPLSDLHQHVEVFNLYGELSAAQQARVLEVEKAFQERNRAATRPPDVQASIAPAVTTTESERPMRVHRRR